MALRETAAKEEALSRCCCWLWADEEWNRLSHLAGQERPLNASGATFRWALCAVWSRSFQLRCADADCGGAAGTSSGVWRVLAPAADLLNHDGGGTAGASLKIRARDERPERWHRGAEWLQHGEAAGAAAAGAEESTLDDAAWATRAGDEAGDALTLQAARPLAAGQELLLDSFL